MRDENRLTRGLASGVLLAGGVAICAWMWPADGSLVLSSVAIVTVVVSLAVVASLWKK
jgi:membrane protein YdbS with pleckstrin-like domain